MIASVLIDPMLPALKTSYPIEEVLEWMEESGLSQLPVVDDEKYLGLVSVSAMTEWNPSGAVLSSMPLDHIHLHADEDQHILELIGLAVKHRVRVVPVLAKNGSYLGAISVPELFEKYCESIGATEAGAIVVLDVKPQDYSLSEISRLVESNGAKVVMSRYSGSHMYETPGNQYLTLKLNQVDVAHILATFERFGYTVAEVHASEPVSSVDQERLDMLMRYLAT